MPEAVVWLTLCPALSPEALAFSCFTELMKRMNQNFPHGGAMDTHFANMRSLIQVGPLRLPALTLRETGSVADDLRVSSLQAKGVCSW